MSRRSVDRPALAMSHPTCARKSWYRTKTAARDQARRSSKSSGETITAYKCPHCGMYHIGHPPRVTTRRRRRK